VGDGPDISQAGSCVKICSRDRYVALAANHLLTVVLRSKGLKRRLYDTTPETEDQVKSRLLKHPNHISRLPR